jgi:hypothetical protein
MYVSISKNVAIGDIDETIEVDKADNDINIHLNGLYLAFTPKEWDELVVEVARKRGLDVSEQPFTGATVVTIPGDPLGGGNYDGQQPEEAT